MTSEFKFPCPACGQSLQATTHDCGSKVQCPLCKAEIVIPQPEPESASGDRAIPAPRHAHAAPRASGTADSAPPPQDPPMCKLAVASFWLSVSSLLIWPFGFIPGIIYGRKAKAELEWDSSLGGRHLAQMGIAIGYTFAAIFGVLLVVGALVVFKPFTRTSSSEEAAAKSDEPAETEEKEDWETEESSRATSAGWTLDLTKMTIPTGTVSGKVRGTEFKLDQVSLVGTNMLVFRESTNTTDRSVVVLLNPEPGESLGGKRIEIQPGSSPPRQHVNVAWWDEQRKRQFEQFTNGYALKLEFKNATGEHVAKDEETGEEEPRASEEPRAGMMAGTIYLCLPDADKSYLAGSFDAKLVVPRPVVLAPRPRPVAPPPSVQQPQQPPPPRRGRRR